MDSARFALPNGCAIPAIIAAPPPRRTPDDVYAPAGAGNGCAPGAEQSGAPLNGPGSGAPQAREKRPPPGTTTTHNFPVSTDKGRYATMVGTTTLTCEAATPNNRRRRRLASADMAEPEPDPEPLETGPGPALEPAHRDTEQAGRTLPDVIAEYGWTVVGVEDEPPFAYTIGLTGSGHPELTVAGLDHRTMTRILNKTAIRATLSPLHHGQTLRGVLDDGYDVLIVDGPIPAAQKAPLRPAMAMNYYGRDNVRVQQVVWPDAQHRMPWQDGYDVPDTLQPLLTGRDGLPDYQRQENDDVEETRQAGQSPATQDGGSGERTP